MLCSDSDANRDCSEEITSVSVVMGELLSYGKMSDTETRNTS